MVDPASDSRATPESAGRPDGTRARRTRRLHGPRVRAISAAQPFSWLGYGLRDLRAAPGPSLFHGIVFALVGIGSATWLLGLVIVMPILGHTSWHAYRNLVERAAADPMH